MHEIHIKSNNVKNNIYTEIVKKNYTKIKRKLFCIKLNKIYLLHSRILVEFDKIVDF